MASKIAEDNFQNLVMDEYRRATGNWPAWHSAHEGYGVMLEEFDELWEHVKTKQKNRDYAAMRNECVQVAAMAMRMFFDCCCEDSPSFRK